MDASCLVNMELPLRGCNACSWLGVILNNVPSIVALPVSEFPPSEEDLDSNIVLEIPVYELEFEPVNPPAPCKFCPMCGGTLRERI